MIEDHLKNIESEIAAIRAEQNPISEPQTVKVSTQTELQKAIDTIINGKILVKPGVYDSIILQNGRHDLTIESDTTLGSGRVENDWSPALVHVKNLKIESRAEGYTLQGMKFLPKSIGEEIVGLGSDKETNPENTPNDIIFDQCIVSANIDLGGKRGFRLNCRHVEIWNSRMENFWYSNDSQAIACWNGPGPCIVHNCYLSASGENFISGGADSLNESMQPSYIKFTNNHCFKPESWIAKPLTTVKNLFELKDCTQAIIQNNLFEGNWKDGQTGYAIVFTPRNQNGNEPFAVVKNIDFSWNVIRNSGAGISIMGDDNIFPSLRTENILIYNNLMYNIDPVKYSGSAGRLFFISRSPKNITVKNNTCVGNKLNSFFDIEHTPERLMILNNIFTEGSYGLKTTKGLGLLSFQQTTIESDFRENVIIPSGIRSMNYGTVNQKITVPLTPDFHSTVSAGVDVDELRRKVIF
jgi:hypothetical protein